MAMGKDTFRRLTQALRSTRAATELESRLGSVGLTGSVFYHDPTNGDDNNTGKRSDNAKGTLQACIDLCTANKGDVIVRMRGYSAPAATINFNVFGITVVAQTWGMNPRAQGEWFAEDTSNTDGPAARITEACTIIGLGFFGAQASGDNVTAAVILDGSSGATDGYGTHLYRCRIGNWNRAAVNYGVYNLGVANALIEECYFVGGVANVLEAGILHDEHITAGGGRPGEVSSFRNNFEHCTYAHEVVSGSRVTNCVWDGDKMGFNFAADAYVKMLKLNVLGGGGAVHGAHVMNCNFATGVDTGTYSHALSSLVTEGYQFSGNHYGTDLSMLSG